MPETKVYFYRENDKVVPVFDWLKGIYKKDFKAYTYCIERIDLLKEFGHQLRRPHADYLQDGIYELRIKSRRTQYRILYFFHGQNAIILAHGLIKEDKILLVDIERAKRRKAIYESNPDNHRY